MLPVNDTSCCKLKQTHRSEKDTEAITAKRKKNCFTSFKKGGIIGKISRTSPSLIVAKKRNKQIKNAAVICSLCNNSLSRPSQSLKAYVSFHGVGFADCSVGLMSRETKRPQNHSSSD